MRDNGGWFVEICAVSKVSKKEIGRVFKLILKNLETSVELITTGDFMVRPNSSAQISLVMVVIVVVAISLLAPLADGRARHISFSVFLSCCT